MILKRGGSVKPLSRLDKIYRNSLQYFGLIMALLPSDAHKEIIYKFDEKILEIPNDIKEDLLLNDYLNYQLINDSTYSLIIKHTGIKSFVKSGDTITAVVERNEKKYEIVVIEIKKTTNQQLPKYEDITKREEEKNQKALYVQLADKFESFIKGKVNIEDFIESYTDCSYDFTKYTSEKVLQGNSVLPMYNEMNCICLDLCNRIQYSEILKSNTLKSLKVYSGNNMIYSRGGVAALALKGESIHLFTSMSTSVQLTTALAFTLEKICPVIYEINIPDTLLSYVFPVENVTINNGEFEIILPLSSKLQIDGFEIKHYSVKEGDHAETHYYDILTLKATLMQPDPDIIELYKNVFTCGDANIMRGGGNCKFEGRWIDVDFGNGSFLTTKELEMLKTDIEKKLKKSPKTAITKRISHSRTVTENPDVKRTKIKYNDDFAKFRQTFHHSTRRRISPT